MLVRLCDNTGHDKDGKITERKISQSFGFLWEGQNLSIIARKRKVHQRKKKQKNSTGLKRGKVYNGCLPMDMG